MNVPTHENISRFHIHFMSPLWKVSLKRRRTCKQCTKEFAARPGSPFGGIGKTWEEPTEPPKNEEWKMNMGSDVWWWCCFKFMIRISKSKTTQSFPRANLSLEGTWRLLRAHTSWKSWMVPASQQFWCAILKHRRFLSVKTLCSQIGIGIAPDKNRFWIIDVCLCVFQKV